MTSMSYHVTEALLTQKEEFPTDVDANDSDSDLSEEEEYSPKELIQGPSSSTDRFSKRGLQKPDCSGPKRDPKKDQNNPPQISQFKTNIPPPPNKPNAANYPASNSARK